MDNTQLDPDVELHKKMLAGDVDEETWCEFLGRIYGWICHHYPALYAEADDLADEVGVCALHNLTSFRGDARFIRWVNRIAHHVVCKQLRKHAGAVVISFEELSKEIAFEDKVDKQDLKLAAEAALQTLTNQERNVFLWRVIDDLDHKEIARRIGISPNASRESWMRASVKIGRYRKEQQW